jgi:hypothetical protein
MPDFAARPTSSFGYFRATGGDGPSTQGQGSGQGPADQGYGRFLQGQGTSVIAPGPWEPDIGYLFVLIVAEMIVFAVIGRMLERWPLS